jgi:hypothetical protein
LVANSIDDKMPARIPIDRRRASQLALAAVVFTAAAVATTSSVEAPSALGARNRIAMRHGTLVGMIETRGGPPISPGIKTPGLAGEVSVFTQAGRPVLRQHVGKGHDFRFQLAPGYYLLNAGRQLYYKSPLGCPPAKAHVRLGHETRADVAVGCGIP